jgi:hypothetical protein
MKCFVLVSNKLGGVPLVECGAVTLEPEHKLIVREEIAERMLRTYAPKLIKAGECDMAELRSGSYQVVSLRDKDPEVEKIVKSPDAFEDLASNRSMENPKAATRVKRKGK